MKETVPKITRHHGEPLRPGAAFASGANHLTVANAARPPLRFQHDADWTKAAFENASPVSVDVAWNSVENRVLSTEQFFR